MKIIAAFLSIALLHSCAYQNPHASHTERDATTGALLGGAIGGMIGHQSNEGLAGAALGAGIGGLLGGAAGQSKDRRQYHQGQNYGGPSYNYHADQRYAPRYEYGY